MQIINAEKNEREKEKTKKKKSKKTKQKRKRNCLNYTNIIYNHYEYKLYIFFFFNTHIMYTYILNK